MTKFLTLVNDERKGQHILSAKGCEPINDFCSVYDHSYNTCDALGGYTDTCTHDYAGCRAGAIDYCDIDYESSCSAYDSCVCDGDY